MKPRARTLFFLSAIAIIFTAGLTFASIELPHVLDTCLATLIATPDIATGLDATSEFKTDLYLQHYWLRPVGYCCLTLIVIMIVAGFMTEKSGLTSAGAVLLFLPVFGHFAATMFFLGGLGFLRLLWLPALDVSFNLFRLGDIVNVPYDLLARLISSAGLDPAPGLSWSLTGIGLILFSLGTVTWFTSRMQKREVADFWVYRFSRHPQYLGWIIWSYGILYLPGSDIRLCYGLSNSLPWLLSTMIIVGVAMLEELKMKRLPGEPYEAYRKRTPFLFPLPRWFARLLTLPLRLTVKKEFPDRKREIVGVLAFYTSLCLALSLLYGSVARLAEESLESSKEHIDELARVLVDARSLAEKRRAAGELERIGDPAMESLLSLLDEDVPQVRAYVAGALGGMTPDRVIEPLTALLHDSDSYVRRTAAGSLGRTGSPRAMQPLVEAMNDPKQDVAAAAVRALGQLQDPAVVPHLIRALQDTALRIVAPAAAALGERGAGEAIGPLVRCFEESASCPYDVVGEALWKLTSDRAIDAWIAGLKNGSWWYPRAACATALGRVKAGRGIEPLAEVLGDSDPRVRRAAVLALMDIGSEKALGRLEGATQDIDFEVRIYANEAVERIKSRK